MFMCIYEKANNVVVELRNDTSTPQTTTAEQYLTYFCDGNNKNIANYNYAEMPFQQIELVVGQYLYDQNTNSIVVNPNWIPPATVETSSIPVSDPAGGSNA
jgi:hypothetical protein